MLYEKFKPNNFKQLVCNEDSIFMLDKILKKIGIFNILISGPAGIGKNSLFSSFLNQISHKSNDCELIELFGNNANKLKNTKEIITDFLENNFSKIVKKKIIIIKNSNYLPFETQLFLRKFLENFSTFYNFWFLAKSVYKLNNGISSRCVKIILKKQGFKQITVRIKEMTDKEKIFICLEILEKFVSLGKFNFILIYNFLNEFLIFAYTLKIKSLSIHENFTHNHTQNFYKDFFLRDCNYTYIKKMLGIKIRHSNSKLKFWNTDWFFLNNLNIVYN